MASGYVGVLTCELHFPEAHSLKEKRHHLRSAKAQLQHRFGASVAEVDHHDVWQRTRLTVACVAREHREVERLLDEAERWLSVQSTPSGRWPSRPAAPTATPTTRLVPMARAGSSPTQRISAGTRSVPRISPIRPPIAPMTAPASTAARRSGSSRGTGVGFFRG